MSNSNFNFQNDQGYNSRGNQNYEGFNQDSSYRFQNNDRDLEQSSSQSSIYTKYLELQIRMLQQTATLQGPSINSDEYSASQSCNSNSNQLRYIQSTPSSVTTLPVVAPQGPYSSNELGNQQGPTFSQFRDVLPLTLSLSSSLTLPASEQSVATPTTNQSSTEPRFPANQTIRQHSDSSTTYDRAPNHDRVVLKLNSTRSEALQVIANLKSEFHTHHHREVVHISYERTLIYRYYCTKTIRLSVTVVTFGIVGQGSASLSTLNGFGLRLLVLRIRPSMRLSVTYMSSAT